MAGDAFDDSNPHLTRGTITSRSVWLGAGISGGAERLLLAGRRAPSGLQPDWDVRVEGIRETNTEVPVHMLPGFHGQRIGARLDQTKTLSPALHVSANHTRARRF